MQNSTAIRECDVDTVRIISIKGISKVGNSFLSDLGRPGKSYNLGQELLYIVCHYHIRSVTWVGNYYIWSVTSFLGVTVGLLAQQGPNILGFNAPPLRHAPER